MARGFESKDVEFQQAEAQRFATLSRGLSAAERDLTDRRRAVQLSLTRMRTALETATAPAHRHTIEQALGALQAELAGLSDR
jgi:hypothetical protein